MVPFSACPLLQHGLDARYQKEKDCIVECDDWSGSHCGGRETGPISVPKYCGRGRGSGLDVGELEHSPSIHEGLYYGQSSGYRCSAARGRQKRLKAQQRRDDPT